MTRASKYKQKGMALITVLMLVAIIVSIGALISDRLFQQVRHTQYLRNSVQAKWYFSGALEALKSVLWRDLQDEPKKTHLKQYWSSPVKQFPLEDALLEFEIKDGFTCINLNGVNQTINTGINDQNSEQDYMQRVFVLLLDHYINDEYRATQMTEALQDWIDKDDITRPFGSENSFYSSLEPGYFSANQMLYDFSELRLVNGFDPKTLKLIKESLCVLPIEEVKININTLTAKQAIILVAVSLGELSEDRIIEAFEARPITGWDSLSEFYKIAGVEIDSELKKILDKILVLHSSYFWVDLRIKFEDNMFFSNNLIYRNEKDVTILRQKLEATSD